MIHGVLLIIFIPILLRKRKGALNIQLIIFRFETTTDFVGFKNYITYAVMQNKNFSFLLRTAKELLAWQLTFRNLHVLRNIFVVIFARSFPPTFWLTPVWYQFIIYVVMKSNTILHLLTQQTYCWQNLSYLSDMSILSKCFLKLFCCQLV